MCRCMKIKFLDYLRSMYDFTRAAIVLIQSLVFTSHVSNKEYFIISMRLKRYVVKSLKDCGVVVFTLFITTKVCKFYTKCHF